MIAIKRILLIAPLLLGFGCSGKGNPNAPASVAGEVTYNKVKLGGGTITFYGTGPDGKETVNSCSIQADGTFSTTDIPAGEMLVTIETDSVKDVKKQEYKDRQGRPMSMSPAPPGRGGSETKEAQYMKIPDKYKNKARSGLTVTLKPGKNSVPFDLAD